MYFILLARHFLGNKISNLDALGDYVGKENIIGEYPLLNKVNSSEKSFSLNIADELLNKAIYEITH